MAIAKLALVNIIGNISSLDEVILSCLERGDFHPERSIDYSGTIRGFAPLEGVNPYAPVLAELESIAAQAGIALPKQRHAPPKGTRLHMQSCTDFCRTFSLEVAHLKEKLSYLRGEIETDERALFQLEHIREMDFDFDQLFSCRYLKLRIGRMPVDSMQKLSYYHDHLFVFTPLGREKEFCWGIYFTPADYASEVDDIFSSLYFERIRLPDFVHGSPDDALDKIRTNLATNRHNLAAAEAQTKSLIEARKTRFAEVHSQIRFLSRSFEMRSYVSVLRRNFLDLFHITGFIEESKASALAEQLGEIKDVTVELLPAGSDKRIKDPTKLKNNWFCKPFEMFVDMYGLPSYSDVDPTPFLAITYCLLFGIMFGDLGQGLLLILAGELLWRLKHMNIGRIISRLGIFSSIFGTLYGSVFGMENLLDPLFHSLGFAHKPIEVLSPEMTNVILIGAVGLGVVLILISMLFNIVIAARKRDAERALLSANGVAGLVFYSSVLVGAVMLLMAGRNLFSPLYLIVLVFIPLLLVLFKEPLGELLRGKSLAEAKPHDGMGNYLMVGFFELFEVVLSFFSNTMSFLRVGGFVLSHAGMMAVVMTLAEMTGGGAAGVFVIIIGNLFVIGMEGLIVGIQVLRLEFYEMFSRYFDGDGKPFLPVGFADQEDQK